MTPSEENKKLRDALEFARAAIVDAIGAVGLKRLDGEAVIKMIDAATTEPPREISSGTGMPPGWT